MLLEADESERSVGEGVCEPKKLFLMLFVNSFMFDGLGGLGGGIPFIWDPDKI